MILELDEHEVTQLKNVIARGAGEANQRLYEIHKQADRLIRVEPEREAETIAQLQLDKEHTRIFVNSLESMLARLGMGEQEAAKLIEEMRKDVLVRAHYLARTNLEPGVNSNCIGFPKNGTGELNNVHEY